MAMNLGRYLVMFSGVMPGHILDGLEKGRGGRAEHRFVEKRDHFSDNAFGDQSIHLETKFFAPHQNSAHGGT
jgi:hypothetical protein